MTLGVTRREFGPKWTGKMDDTLSAELVGVLVELLGSKLILMEVGRQRAKELTPELTQDLVCIGGTGTARVSCSDWG